MCFLPARLRAGLRSQLREPVAPAFHQLRTLAGVQPLTSANAQKWAFENVQRQWSDR